MSESTPTSDVPATLDTPTVSDASSMDSASNTPAPIVGDNLVSMIRAEGIRTGELRPPAPDAEKVYISLTFFNLDRALAQMLIENARSTVGREESFMVTFAEAFGEG
jgi:hypothetical protein